MEDLPRHRALTARFGSAGAMLLVFVLAGLLAAVGPQDSVAAISRRAESAPPSGDVLAQTDLPPPGSDLEREEEDWEEEPADTLSPPQGFTPSPSPAAAADSTPAVAADSTRGAATDSLGAAADSTRGAAADSTGRAVILPARPAVGDTLRYVPGVTNAEAPAPKPTPTQVAPERKGLLGLHPAAIAFGLVLAHYFIVKAATD